VIELYAPHIRRIAASALPGGHRAIPKRLLYDLGGNMIECRELAGRWHIRGDAVMTGCSIANGELTGSVRVFAENARKERYSAEILLRFGCDATLGGDEGHAAYESQSQGRVFLPDR
jgi:hypothetical protein